MKLRELTVHGFRAFPPEEQTFEFDEANAVIQGDNGTGKSSILGAIEFLVCGNLSHLGGPGTGDIRVSTHAPHQAANPEECYVEGEFVTSDDQVGRFRRTASDTTTLELVSGEIDPDMVDISQWNDDHLILTRAQLTDFIESSPSDRGDELSSLLNLNGVQNRANGLTTVETEITNKRDSVKEKCERLVGDISSALNLTVEFPLNSKDRTEICEQVNEKLERLDADPIESLDQLAKTLDDLELEPSEEVRDPFYHSSTTRRIEETRSQLHDQRTDIRESLEDLNIAIDELRSVEQRSLRELDLIEAADGIVTPDTNECPLCGATHETGYLHDRVRQRKEQLAKIRDLKSEIENQRTDLRQSIDRCLSPASELNERIGTGLDEGEHESVTEDVEQYRMVVNELEDLSERLDDPIIEETDDGQLEISDIDPDDLAPDIEPGINSLEGLERYMDSLEPRDKISDVFADLIRAQDALEDLSEARDRYEQLQDLVAEIDTITEIYTKSREQVLGDLYASIEDDFNDYYTTIHPDEDDIDLNLDHEGTESVELEATHERERDSPLAFHSEGHIDTMGLCLFFALRQELDSSGVDVVMLDDVVMSVDKNHRLGVVRLLKDHLDEDNQIIIATHDEIWADQLEREGIVSNTNNFSILDWDVSTGPILNEGKWDVVKRNLEAGDTNAAAVHLRRTAEKICNQAAAQLNAPIEYKDHFFLSDYIKAINRRLRDHLNSVKRKKQDGTEMHNLAIQLDNKRGDLIGDPRYEELNSNVHYNRDQWGQLSEEDLTEVLEHWKAIESHLRCSNCGWYMSYSEDGSYRWVQCNCRDIQLGYKE